MNFVGIVEKNELWYCTSKQGLYITKFDSCVKPRCNTHYQMKPDKSKERQLWTSSMIHFLCREFLEVCGVVTFPITSSSWVAKFCMSHSVQKDVILIQRSHTFLNEVVATSWLQSNQSDTNMSQQVTAFAPGLSDKKPRYTPGWSHKLVSHKILNRVFSKKAVWLLQVCLTRSPATLQGDHTN
jgi:hypothetical protein